MDTSVFPALPDLPLISGEEKHPVRGPLEAVPETRILKFRPAWCPVPASDGSVYSDAGKDEGDGMDVGDDGMDVDQAEVKTVASKESLRAALDTAMDSLRASMDSLRSLVTMERAPIEADSLRSSTASVDQVEAVLALPRTALAQKSVGDSLANGKESIGSRGPAALPPKESIGDPAAMGPAERRWAAHFYPACGGLPAALARGARIPRCEGCALTRGKTIAKDGGNIGCVLPSCPNFRADFGVPDRRGGFFASAHQVYKPLPRYYH
jgi:hypothetical protein